MGSRSLRLVATAGRWEELEEEIVACRRCPRLVEWRERVATEKRAAYAEEEYWGRPVPGFGDRRARVLVVGLAPAAHGANRTGRMFTGDRSGDFLYASLHRTGFADRPEAVSRDDGLALADLFVTAGVRCAPPENKPTPDERDRCFPYLLRELDLLDRLRVVVPLGGFGYTVAWRALAQRGLDLPRPRPAFGHGVEVDLGDVTVLCSFHPSQQNTFTGKLTEDMLDRVFERAAALARAGDGR